MTDLATRYDELRPLVFSVAYRMLGSVAEAEDVAQEAFLRMHREADRIDSAEAFAVTVTTRLAIDQLRSARVRRERYVGTWLPEPLLTAGADADPAARKAPAVTKPVSGRVRVARFMLGLMRQAAANRLRVEEVPVNGQPGARVLDQSGEVLAVLSVHVADGQILALHNVLNPDKLLHLRGPRGR